MTRLPNLDTLAPGAKNEAGGQAIPGYLCQLSKAAPGKLQCLKP